MTMRSERSGVAWGARFYLAKYKLICDGDISSVNTGRARDDEKRKYPYERMEES